MSRPKVAIINTSVDAISVLEENLRSEFDTVRAFARDFRRGERDLDAFLREHEPAVVLWDLAIPYYHNWTYLRGVKERGAFGACELIMTSASPERLSQIVGMDVGALELDERPDRQAAILDRVRRAAESRSR